MLCVPIRAKANHQKMMSRSYSELRGLSTFEERFEYLCMVGQVGEVTFGFDRWMNQQFYHSPMWRHARDEVIVRDQGCDLGIQGYEIHGGLLVHHMNPMTAHDIAEGAEWILDPEFLITTTHRTHNAIHYGDYDLLPRPVVARHRGDTSVW